MQSSSFHFDPLPIPLQHSFLTAMKLCKYGCHYVSDSKYYTELLFILTTIIQRADVNFQHFQGNMNSRNIQY